MKTKSTKKRESNNCQCCGFSYDSYKVGTESEIFSTVSMVPTLTDEGKILEPKGLCPFCNPKSFWFNHSKTHSNESCREDVEKPSIKEIQTRVKEAFNSPKG